MEEGIEMNASGTLVCSQDERIHAAVTDPEVVSGGVEVLERDEHDVVVLDAHCDHDTLAYIRSLKGGRRRDLTVVLVVEDAETGDRDRAWRGSVDFVMNVKDLDRFDSLLQEFVWDKGRFYERFRGIESAQGEG